MNRMKVLATIALAASVLGAHAQTTTNATPNGDHVIQGNFADASADVFLLNNSNRDRVGGGGAVQRINQPILGFDLPSIPAGETIQAATFSFQMLTPAISSAPLTFDMVISLMNATNVSEITAADFVEATAAVNSTLVNGIVIGQLAEGDVSDGATMEISLTGAALSQLATLYDGAGNPSQSTLWFRLSTSTNAVYPASNNDRFQLDDTGGSVIRSLELDWGEQPSEASATPSPAGDFVIQGNFQDGVTANILLTNNSNRDRVGVGGGNPTQRVNQPIVGFTLPSIPAGESVSEATFSFKMKADHLTGDPLLLDMVVSLMDATNSAQLAAADFVEATAPVNSSLNNGIVIGQIADTDTSSGGTVQIGLTGAALAQITNRYDVAGNPSSSEVYFRLSTSTPLDWGNTNMWGDRFNLDDTGGSIVRDLVVNWGEPAPDIYYVASTPTNWAVGSAWSDGNAATIGNDYFVTNGVALQTPSTTATFPGASLNLVGSQTVELMVTGSDVITFSSLDLDGDTLRAGVVDSGEAKVNGTLNALGNATLSGATDLSRNLRVLAQITGSSTVTLTAPGQTNFIDNAANAFEGTWNLTGNYAEFTSPGAVGTASIEVGNFGKLRILGDWDGLATGESLTVADSSNAVVEVGANAWTVSALTFGSSNVVDGAVYTTAELNAMGSNAVFTGAGTIQVGLLPLPAPGELLFGLDTFESSTAPTADFTATDITATITASGTGGNWSITDSGGDPGRGSSKDGSWGTYDGGGSNTASTVTTAGTANFTLTNGKTDGQVTITFTNTGPSAIDLGQIHFDAVAFRPNAARTYAVNVLAGSDITVGNVYTSDAGAITHLGGGLLSDDLDPLTHDQHDDIDIGLTGIADHTLEAGGVAIIQLAFSGGTGSGSGHHLFLDNIGITAKGETVVVPPEPPVMNSEVSGGNVTITWTSDGSFKLQTRPNLVIGDWVDVPGATASPVVVSATNDVEFLRLIEQ